MAAPVTGSFTATGQSSSFRPVLRSANGGGGAFNISLWGTFSGSVTVQRSFDGGTTWVDKTPSSIYTLTAPASFTDEEPEVGVIYRLNCTSYVSGTINYRISQ